MKYLLGTEEDKARKYMEIAAKIAFNSCCLKSRCGCVIVNKEIIGMGFNSPPDNRKIAKCLKDELPADFKSDKTCCVHAEQRAIMDALKNHPDKVRNSKLYFIRIDEKGEKRYADKPYCTICSKMALDVGIKEFLLWHDKGICSYDTEEYNNLSFGQTL
jgi:deoxycytidylate deaminase